MDINIRSYDSKDYQEVYNILYNTFGKEKVNKGYGDNYLEFVAEYDNKIVGYFILTRVFDVVTDRKYFLVDYVCVSDEYKRHGIGKKMMDYAIEFGKNDGAIYMELHSGSKRVAAHELYKKCGYEQMDKYLFRRMF